MDIFTTLIVEESKVDIARKVLAYLSNELPENEISAPLSPTGVPPATHHTTSGWMKEAAALAFREAGVMYASCAAYDLELFVTPETTLGLSLTDCEAILAAADVSDEEPFVAFARLGLSLAFPPQDV